MSKKIIFIIGSLRKNSFNRQMAKEAKNLIGDRVEVEFLEYEDIENGKRKDFTEEI